MSKMLCVLVALLLGGCVSKVVEYAAAPITDGQARSVIEQVLMEQPQKTRPEQVIITSKYVRQRRYICDRWICQFSTVG